VIVLRDESVRVAVVGGGSNGAVHTRPAVSLRALVCAGVLAVLAGGAALVGVRAGHSGAAAGRQAAASRPGLSSLPLALQGPVSASLGADERGYGARAAAGGFAIQNPAQRLGARFDATGAQISSGALRVKLSLQGVGYGSALRALPAVAPRAHGNRVSYGYPGLSAWFVNGPLGLEQGFTIARPNTHARSGALTLALTVGDRVPVSLVGGGHSARFGRAAGPSLRYSGLSATDARGHELASWLEVHQGRLLLRVDTRGAIYPLHIDPFLQPGETLTGGSEEIGKSGFGDTVAISADGDTALIGAYADNSFRGAAWVFTLSESGWTQQGPKLTGGSEEVERGDFGNSVALSADGATALIGAPEDNKFHGAAWVFTRSGSTWIQQGPKLTVSEEVGKGRFGFGDSFGATLALSADGNTALIGAYKDNHNVGAAWVFARSGSTWTQQGPKLTGGSEEVGEGVFGCCALALSADGSTALIGGPDDNGEAGAAWVFTRSESTWTRQGPKLIGGSEEVGQGHFGFSVALTGDGDTALIGAYADNTRGAAWVFTRSGSTWTQQGPKLTGRSEGVGKGDFGISVAISADANSALVGASRDKGFRGAVWAFENTSAPRPEVASVAPAEGPASGGTTVTITGNNLFEASAVSFGSLKAASFSVDSPSSIMAVSPRAPAGEVDITVRTPTGGLSLRTANDAYEFKPTVTALSPNTGPSAGGTGVTVTGAGFGLGSEATVFKFGSTPATSVNCVSSMECTLVSPAHAAGKVSVKATVNKVNSATTKAAHFTYE
jgi:IPT/TIG domain/FG-GAP repeat